MNTLYKLLKITGAICLLCVCLISKADPKIMTLEELQAFLDQKCRETSEKFGEIQKKIGKIIEAGKPEDAVCKEETDTLLKLYDAVNGSIASVNYDDNSKPTLIEVYYTASESTCDNSLKEIFVKPHLSRRQYTQAHSENTPRGLDRISRIVTKEDLKKRGITDGEFKLLGDASVREITFESILSSNFFDEKHRERGKELFCNSEPSVLRKAIDAYVEEVAILESVSVIIRVKKIGLDVVGDQKSKKATVNVRTDTIQESKHELVCKASGERLEELKKGLGRNLRLCLLAPTGVERIVLLLLLDEMTPPKYRLEWIHSATSDYDGGYQPEENRIKAPFISKTGASVISHELGHHLQCRLRLTQTFENYQNPFAKKLLLLEHECKKGNRMFFVPKPFRDLIEKFNEGNGNSPQNLTEEDLFAYWQLISRWDSANEISNGLGVYFGRIRNKIYINVLSDIHDRCCIAYGHTLGQYKNAEIPEFEDINDRNAFENIVKETAQKQPDTAVLKLVCKLHRIAFKKVVDLSKPEDITE